MLLAPIPWAKRVWALPFLTALAPSQRYWQQHKRQPKVLTDWARQLVLQVQRWVPTRTLVLVADGGFAALELLARLTRGPRHVICITRLRLDARLFSRRRIDGRCFAHYLSALHGAANADDGAACYIQRRLTIRRRWGRGRYCQYPRGPAAAPAGRRERTRSADLRQYRDAQHCLVVVILRRAHGETRAKMAIVLLHGLTDSQHICGAYRIAFVNLKAVAQLLLRFRADS